MAQYTRTTTVDTSPGGDTVKQAVVDVDVDLTGIVTAYNTHDTGTTAVHGVGAGTVCGTTLTQTLTNKTLSAPTLTGTVTASGATVVSPTITNATIQSSTLNGLTHTAATTGFTIAGGTASKTLTVDSDTTTSQAVMTGEIRFWPLETVPGGYLECNGASLDRSTYANLFAVLGTIYGTADASHFNIPDYRGKFPRFWDHAKAIDPDRAARTAVTTTGATMTAGDHVGTEQGEQLGAHVHSVDPPNTNTSGAGSHNHTVGFSSTAYPGAVANEMVGGAGGVATSTVADHVHAIDIGAFNSASAGGNETRPVNVYLMAIIKY